MPTAIHLIETIGAAALNGMRRLTKFGRLGSRIVAVALQRHTYNSAVVDILFKQIYFTAVQVLPIYFVLALALNSVVIGIIVSLSRDYGLMAYGTKLVMGFVGVELVPLVTAILVALRSGSAINSEVSLMRVNRELDALLHCGVDPIRYEFFPRVVGGIISLCALTLVGLVVTIAVAFATIGAGEFSNWERFSHSVGDALSFRDLLLLGIKSAVFGICVTLIPIASGMETPRRPFAVPISVLRGMMGVFLALLLVEIASLVLKYM